MDIYQNNYDDYHTEQFIIHYKFYEKTNEEILWAIVYYAFTSLSTVGFGDFRPWNDAERLCCAAILLVGVTVFSFIMEEFIQIMYTIILMDGESDEQERLYKFFNVIKAFNSGKPISDQHKQ